MLPPELLFSTQICIKSFVGWGFAPDPTGVAYSASQTPSWFKGCPPGKGREREGEKEGREVKRKEGKEEGNGRKGEEMCPQSRNRVDALVYNVFTSSSLLRLCDAQSSANTSNSETAK